MKEIIYLHDSLGNTTVFNSKKELAKELGYGFIYNNVTKFIGKSSDIIFYDSNRDYGRYIIRNEYNESLTINDFLEVFNELKKERNIKKRDRWDRLYGWNGYGAVPGTGGRSYGNYFRHPKTLKTLKYAVSDVVDFEPIVKIRGGKSNIPTSYSDIRKERCKNWKEFRKNQYKN